MGKARTPRYYADGAVVCFREIFSGFLKQRQAKPPKAPSPLGMKLLPWSAGQEIPQEPLRTISVARKEVLVRDTSRASHTSISKGMFS
jgi:hypothetical protein